MVLAHFVEVGPQLCCARVTSSRNPLATNWPPPPSVTKTSLGKTQDNCVFLFVMGIEKFIHDALHHPNDYVAYHVARELAELHPGKTILEGINWEFDLEAFVRAGKCSVVE